VVQFPLESNQNIHDSIPRGIQAVLQTVVAKLCINKEMCIFHNCFHCFDHPFYIFIQWLILINLTTYSLTSTMLLYSLPVCGFACVYPFSVRGEKKVNYISVFFCQVCPQIGLCPPAESVVALDPTHVVNDKPTCPLCLLATQSIIDKLKDNKTEVRGSVITLVEVRPHCLWHRNSCCRAQHRS
jgi:hypothetical protein